MSQVISKTDYLLFRECPKNAWLKIHKPEVYQKAQLSEFEKAIIETGNEVELTARQLFPSGVLIEGRDAASQEATKQYLSEKKEVLFQPIFVKNGFLAAVDILQYHPGQDAYSIYEVKSTTQVDKKTHYHDLAFQVNLLELCGLKVTKAYVIHLNSEYVRQGELQINKLFTTADVIEEILDINQDVLAQMQQALSYLLSPDEPLGACACLYKGRSNHCATFAYSNPKVPSYGVHDLTRIGNSKALLQSLIDVGVFALADISEEMLGKMSQPQQNQVMVYLKDIVLFDRTNTQTELSALSYPLHFLDYETFPSAIPRFDGFSPYQQIPFQYSLYVLDAPDGQLRHREFLWAENSDPSPAFIASLQENLASQGSIIVWNKKFECNINQEFAKRNAAYQDFITQVNERVYDLMDIFSKQYYVHKGFKGRVSIKNVLPVLVPELSYKTLNIQEGGTASQQWDIITRPQITPGEKECIINDLKEYCKLDTLAMYKIWEYLRNLVF